MANHQTVYVVQHLHTHESGNECVKMIGIYKSQTEAEEAVQRVSVQPGFRDRPAIIDPLKIDETDGFYIDEVRLGEDSWTEGYGL